MAVTPLNIADMAFTQLGENVTTGVPTTTVSAGTIVSNVAQLTVASSASFLVGQTVYISGILPADWNGYFVITSIPDGTHIYVSTAAADAYVSGGSVTWAFPYDGTDKANKFNTLWLSNILKPVLVRHPWNGLKVRAVLTQPSLAVTAGSYNSGTNTVTLTVGAHTLQQGQTVTVTGINPASWNGTAPLTAVTATTISFILSASGSYVSGGTVTWGAVFDFSNVYTLPSDILRAIQVNKIIVSDYYKWSSFVYYSIGSVMPPFKIEQGFLLSNESSVDLLYCQLQNPPQDPLLVDLLAARAAWELAFPVTHDLNIKKEKKKDYTLKLREAITENVQQGTPDEFQETSWIQARQ